MLVRMGRRVIMMISRIAALGDAHRCGTLEWRILDIKIFEEDRSDLYRDRIKK